MTHSLRPYQVEACKAALGTHTDTGLSWKFPLGVGKQ